MEIVCMIDTQQMGRQRWTTTTIFNSFPFVFMLSARGDTLPRIHLFSCGNQQNGRHSLPPVQLALLF